MKQGEKWKIHPKPVFRCSLLCVAALVMTLALHTGAGAFTLNVVGSDGGAVGDYRWLLEEDLTYHPNIASPDPNDMDVLAFNFHRSYMPVVAKGTSADLTPLDDPALIDPAKHYFLTVLPMTAGGYTLGGAPVGPDPRTGVFPGSVTVTLNKLPLPTAQISVFVFEDKSPINGTPDLPQELGLEGFIINVREAGGRFGASGELILQDAFGNPLGTTYLQTCDASGANPGSGSFTCLDAEGSPIVEAIGDGVILTNANGVAIIKNLPPAKYGLTVSPPLSAPEDLWHQTSTIEGTPTIDAWVKADEPPYFTEFGPAGHHADFGFVKAMNDTTVLTGGATISGRVVSAHMSRPPDYTVYPGAPFPDAWVGLNDASGTGVYAQPCDAGSNFSIPNVPPGNYQLVIWDNNMDIIIASTMVTVNPDNSCGPDNLSPCNLGDVAVYDWFAHLKGTVFFDTDQNGFQDPGEPGFPNRTVNLRWRDGSIYQATGTKADGSYEFAEVFPFFHWLVAEVDFATHKATGVTVVVDGGGIVDQANENFPGYGRLTPQPQDPADPANEYGDLLWRTESGPVLTQAFQAFLGQTNVINWGKANYNFSIGENGGVSGMVFYDTTRAENDPVNNFGENWQPGVPNVTVRLWGLGSDGLPGTADDVLLNETQTDSWDASLPEGCPSPNLDDPFTALLGNKCYDGLRSFNQVRPGVFDGGYAFTSYWEPSFGAPGAVEVEGLPTGRYVIEVVPPAGYEVVRAQDKNVDFGDDYIPSILALPPACAGEPYGVPQYLALFEGEQVLHPFYDPDSTDYRQPYDPASPVMLNHCDRKIVDVLATKNTPADFFLFTEVPVSGHIAGMILNDLANEFDPNNPNFGEKFAPQWVPIGIYDYAGNQITRVYSDQYGRYNALVPSTYTVNVPSPSGVAPNMLIACMNDPGPIPDPNNPGESIIDPFFDRQYSQFCYTFQYMPGVTTYLDTPVLPTAAFTGQNQKPLDCEFPTKTPVIFTVSDPTNGFGGGPYVPATGREIVITAMGPTTVLNPAYDGTPGTQHITRDYGFGTNPGTVTLGGVPLTNVMWTNAIIRATVPAGAQTGDLIITRADSGFSSPMGLTVTVGPIAGTVRPVAAGGSIQSAIDLAQPGDLVLVAPGTYEELVVLYKDIQLQGWGAPSVTINAVKRPGEKLQAWRDKVNAIVEAPGTQYLLPGQAVDFDPANNEPGLMNTAEGPGIMVFADQLAWQTVAGAPRPRIDGFTITGSDMGGAIVVNAYARNLVIGNNRLISNHGHFAGGIRVGDPDLLGPDENPVDALNDNLIIHHNHIAQNGCTGGGAGGIGLFSGTNGYEVIDNFICGNFTTGTGGGIGHRGLSNLQGKPNLIARNRILFNQSFDQLAGAFAEGGGIFIGGEPPAPLALDALTAGSGSVVVDSNLILGNLAGAGDGGGIRLAYVNGQDVANNPDLQNRWHRVDLFNNIVVNNVTGLAGGGLSMQDAVRTRIIHNTFANNDSTATAGAAFTAGPASPSTPQPAGIVARAHSPSLTAVAGPGFTNPRLFNTIIWHNRSFYWDASANGGLGGLLEAVPLYSDLAVLGAAGALDPRYCILTDTTGYLGSNSSADPAFVHEYVNGNANLPVMPENTTPLTAAAVDEGGNFIDVRFGPLTLYDPVTLELYGDYHLQDGSPAVNAARPALFDIAELASDIDGDARPADGRSDIGADEWKATDTVTITLADYRASDGRVRVRATSNAPVGSVTLTAYALYPGGTATLGQLPYNATNNDYRRNFFNVYPKPTAVMVVSTGGGSDTELLP